MALVFPSSPTTGQVFNPGPGLPSWMWDGTKWTNATTPPLHLTSLSDVQASGATNGQLLTYNGTQWANGGNAIIAAGSGTTTPALTVNCEAGSGPGALVNVLPNGNGLSVSGSGTSSSQYHFMVVNGNDFLFSIWSDGSGFLGPNSITNLNWNAAGNYTIHAPGSGLASLTVLAPAGAPAITIQGSPYAAFFAGDVAVWNAAQTTKYFEIANTAITFPTLGTTNQTATAYLAQAQGNQLYYTTSARRWKTNIRNVTRERARSIIRDLRMVAFNSLCEADDPKQNFYGLIAEEVAAVEPALATFDKDHKPIGVAYDRIAMLMLPLMQEMLGMDEPEGEVYG